MHEAMGSIPSTEEKRRGEEKKTGALRPKRLKVLANS
jgi:hypothetical protein